MAGKHIFEIDVLSPGDLITMVVAASHGNFEAQMLSRIVFDWIGHVVAKEPGQKPLCLNCDAECHNDPSWSIVVSRPYAMAEGQAVVSGVCPDCAAGDDINTVITGKMAELCGGGHIIAEGRA
jgi:hypothetical protein